jgi:integrase
LFVVVVYLEREQRNGRLEEAAAAWGCVKNQPSVTKGSDEGVISHDGSLQMRLAVISRAMADAAVCSSTACAYSTAWRRWERYVLARLEDAGFTAQPQDFEMRGWDRETCITFIVEFYAFLYAFEGLKGATVDSCSSGVKKRLQDRGVDVSIFEDFRCVQARMGSKKLDMQLFPGRNAKLPMTLESVLWVAAEFRNMQTQRGLMMAVATMFGFFSGLRVSEYIQTTTSADNVHVVLSGDVVFRVTVPRRAWITASRLQYDNVKEVDGMQITLRSSKNDQGGSGSRWTFLLGEEEHGQEFLHQMASWAVSASSCSKDPFISWRRHSGVLECLAYRTFLAALKQAMDTRGFDPQEIGTHSLRRGAISQLAAAGVPLEAVKRFARHRSSATTAKYQVQSEKERAGIFKALAEEEHFAEAEVQAVSRKTMRGE